MSGIIPRETANVFRDFNDVGVDIFGIDCDLYIPINKTSIEHSDAYESPIDVIFKKYPQNKVWVHWSVKDLRRLRKMGVFAENETPIIAYFKNFPEVTINSYIKVEVRYIPNNFDTDEFEVVDILMKGTYDSEILRPYKLAPRRARSPRVGLV